MPQRSASRMAGEEVMSISRMNPDATVWQAPQWLSGAPPQRRVVCGLFVLGLVPRLILLAAHAGPLDVLEYETLATNIASGQGYTITRFGHVALAFGDGNLYSFLAASVYVLAGHHPMLLAVVQATLASLAAPVIYALGSRAFVWPVAALGAALAALHPGLLAYTVKLHPLGIDVLLMAMLLLWVGRPSRGLVGGLPTGLALGMSLMSRPTFFLAGVLALLARWRGARGSIKPGLAAVAVAVLIALPWVGRNWAVLGRPLFISTSLEDVWKGNHPGASGSSYLPDGQDVFSAAPPALQARFAQASELELNDIFAAEIVDFVTQHPLDFVGMVARKVVYFWWVSPEAGMLYPAAWLAAYQAYAVVIYAFAAIGSLAIVRQGSTEQRGLLSMLVAVSLTLTVIHALSYVEGRHRWGIEPLVLLLTAHGFSVVGGAWLSARSGAQWRAERRQSHR